jgi:DNA-binding response OmpR family regulator
MQLRPQVLLAPFTGSKYVVEHFEILTFQLDCEVDLTLASSEKNNGPYDLIVQMGLGPKEDMGKGLEYLCKLRGRFPRTPILVISGNDASYAFEQVRQSGADDYLRRDQPNEADEFIAKVRAILKLKTPG